MRKSNSLVEGWNDHEWERPSLVEHEENYLYLQRGGDGSPPCSLLLKAKSQ